MKENNVPTNQIAFIQTDRKLIGFYDKLKAAPTEKYAHIHARNDVVNGKKQNSLIGIQIQDYSKGTGQNNIIVSFNLEPEILKFFLTRVSIGVPDYEWSSNKIFGDPDPSGYSIAQKFTIIRRNLDQQGRLSPRPWFIQISNGKGIKIQNKTGGFYMKGGSYVEEKNAFFNLTDIEFYGLLEKVRVYVECWEHMVSAQAIEQGQKMHAEYLANNVNNRQNSGFPQGGSYQTPDYSTYSNYGQPPANNPQQAGQGYAGQQNYSSPYGNNFGNNYGGQQYGQRYA